jgi:hypothetical protein
MQGSQEIRQALARVAQFRQAANGNSELHHALQTIKHLQAQRFVGTYPDLLADSRFAPSATFFLEELYSAKDYSARDAQFARIAGAVERTFPDVVLSTVCALAQLHLQTETLDMAMAQAWCQSRATGDAPRYLNAWRSVGQRADRNGQLAAVLDIGQTLSRLTQKTGLRLMLKMMRRPAELAGLGALQAFLESGFEHFAGMAKRGQVDTFLGTIGQREADWIERLFDADPVTCEAELARALGLSPGQLSHERQAVNCRI